MRRTFVITMTFFLCLGPVLGLGSRYQEAGAGRTENSPGLRIISLVPSVTETLFALQSQDMIVARTDFCTWPSEALSIPSVGGFDGKTISLERILSFQPDLVCLAEVMHDHLVQPLESLGINVFVSNAESIQRIQNEITTLGSLTGKMDEAGLLLNIISQQLEQASVLAHTYQPSQSPETVYWEVAAAPYFTPGGGSFITDLLRVCGMKNIFAQLPQAYPQVSEESIIAGQPQLIFFPDYKQQGQQGAKSIANRNGWKDIPAVANARIYPVDSDLFSRPGPRIGEMALQLLSLAYGIELETAP